MTQEELTRRIEDLMREIRRLKADNGEYRRLVESLEQELAEAQVTIETQQIWINQTRLHERISMRRVSIN